MSMHVVRMRYRGSHARIQGALFKRVSRSAHVFVRERAIVMSRKITRRQRQGRSVKRELVWPADLSVGKRTGFIRESARDPQPGLCWIGLQRAGDRLSVRGMAIVRPGVLCECEM